MPDEATIQIGPQNTTVNTNITATVTQSDSQSGVNIKQCKWVYLPNGNEIGTEESKYSGIFTENPQPLTLSSNTVGTYYLHVLTIDNVGNKKESISDPVEVTYTETLCANRLAVREPDGRIDDGFNFCTWGYGGGTTQFQMSLRQGEKYYTTIYWKCVPKGENALVNYNFVRSGGNDMNRACYFYVSNAKPVKGVSASGPLSAFLGSVKFSSKQTASDSPYNGSIEVKGLKNPFYVGFMICDEGYGSGSLGCTHIYLNSLSLTFK